MIINKMGSEHFLYGINNQDVAFTKNSYKVVCDGCSEGKASEVGAKLYKLAFPGYLYEPINDISKWTRMWFNNIFNHIVPISEILDHLLFTILVVKETDTEFKVSYCGDGYLIFIDHNNKITIRELENGQVNGNPIYFAYNFLPEDKLIDIKHRDCIFKTLSFSKSEYKNVGVATDGLRYIFGQEFEQQFKELLVKGNEIGIKRLINKFQNNFHDDISIAL